MKILIVEDSATLRHAMCQYVRNAGHTPIVAENGEAALQILDQNSVDMVVMDVEMPGLDGFETTRLIREWLGDFWIPIIFVTGKSEEKDLRQGIDAGGDDYLIKPISETILQAKIRAMGRITAMRDQLNKLNQELTELSERDSLTKLYNRRTFESRAEEQWRLCSRTSEPLSVLLMDIDHFKPYNDYYGHLEGDVCIAKVAAAIQSSLGRPGDLLARFGGEEFIALLPNTDEQGAYHVAEYIRRNVAGLNIKHRASPTGSRVTLSIGGAAVLHTAGTRFLDQIHAADKALYSAKEAGRNQVVIKLFNPKISILVADASSELLRIIDSNMLNHCAIAHARTGEQTVDLAAHKRPDVIVIDLDLPEQQALVCAAEIRALAASEHVPIIFLGEPDHEQQALLDKIDPEAVLPKPVAIKMLLDHLNDLLFSRS